jgi:hypothetical protein
MLAREEIVRLRERVGELEAAREKERATEAGARDLISELVGLRETILVIKDDCDFDQWRRAMSSDAAPRAAICVFGTHTGGRR